MSGDFPRFAHSQSKHSIWPEYSAFSRRQEWDSELALGYEMFLIDYVKALLFWIPVTWLDSTFNLIHAQQKSKHLLLIKHMGSQHSRLGMKSTHLELDQPPSLKSSVISINLHLFICKMGIPSIAWNCLKEKYIYSYI